MTDAAPDSPRDLWNRFCDELRQTGNWVLNDPDHQDPLNQAEGLRYLTRLLRIGLEMQLEFADPQVPAFFMPSHETAKIGADNPDNLYQSARIAADGIYRISGQRNSVHYLSIQTQRGGYADTGKLEQSGFIDDRSLSVDENGYFEIIVSQQAPADSGANWLPMSADTHSVLVRHTFHDRRAEAAASVRIERVDQTDKPLPPTPAFINNGLLSAAKFVQSTAKLIHDWSADFMPAVNTLPMADQAFCRSIGGDPNITYYHGYWALAPEQFMVIHVPRIPDCETWNIQIDNRWMESLDYRVYRCTLNKHSAQRNSDGSVTMVLAHQDPGVVNWLETAGHVNGTTCFRWVGTQDLVDPVIRVTTLEELQATIDTLSVRP